VGRLRRNGEGASWGQSGGGGGEEDSAQGHKEMENLFPIFKHFHKDQSKFDIHTFPTRKINIKAYTITKENMHQHECNKHNYLLNRQFLGFILL
jgi:hypothetical protein